MSQPRVHLDRHPAVHARAGLISGAKYVTGGADVCRRDRPDGFTDVHSADGEIADLLVIRGPAADRLLEDGRVAGDADDGPGAHQLGEVAGA